MGIFIPVKATTEDVGPFAASPDFDLSILEAGTGQSSPLPAPMVVPGI